MTYFSKQCDFTRKSVDSIQQAIPYSYRESSSRFTTLDWDLINLESNCWRKKKMQFEVLINNLFDDEKDARTSNAGCRWVYTKAIFSHGQYEDARHLMSFFPLSVSFAPHSGFWAISLLSRYRLNISTPTFHNNKTLLSYFRLVFS